MLRAHTREYGTTVDKVDKVDKESILKVDKVDWRMMALSGPPGFRQTSDITEDGRVRQKKLVENFLELFEAEMRLRDPRGEQMAKVTDPSQLARQMAERVIDSAKTWSQQLGPVYDVEGVREILARRGKPVTRQAVSKRKSLLALTTGSGRVVYPAFQFHNGAVIKGLREVLKEVPEELVSRWTFASWLVSPEAELDNASPINVLKEGHVPPVVEIARTWAKALQV